MTNYFIQTSRLFSVVTIAWFMLACGSNTQPVKTEFATSSQNLEQILKQADQAEASQKHPLLVQASGILIADKRADKALELFRHIDTRYLNQQQKDTYHLYFGESLLAIQPQETLVQREEKNRLSLSQLLAVKQPSIHSIEWQIRYSQSLSDSYLANHNYLEAARQRIQLEDIIDQPSMLADNNQKIWQAIAQMSPQFLEQMISDFNSKRVNGWLEIVHINQKWGNQPDLLLQKMAQWKQRFPLHPAMQVQPKQLQRLSAIKTIAPKKIAVLLPLSGRFARTGKMVHDGIVAANYQQASSEDIPSIEFYDTAQSLSALVSYNHAIKDGADFVIGPLIKKSINEITQQDELVTPILFLNTTSQDIKRHELVYQFVYSIEDKAIQAAHRAWENGYRKAIAFLPKNQRGERALVAFKDYFEKLGGELVDVQQYQDIKSINKDVQNLLRVNASFARKKDLEQTLGRNIEFEMRRRKDADFIFMIATPKQARRIKPFINFYFALDLPVISTERIFSGVADAQLDGDLNGIEFSDIPLYISQQPDIQQTRKTILEIDPNILKGNNGRFFSMGFDAFQIITQLTKLQAFPDYRWYGLSGEIGVNEDGQVHRYLTWAKFKKGLPKVTKERIAPQLEQQSTAYSQGQ